MRLLAVGLLLLLCATACTPEPVVGTVIGRDHDERHETTRLMPIHNCTHVDKTRFCTTTYIPYTDVDDEDWYVLVRRDKDEKVVHVAVSEHLYNTVEIGSHWGE